MKTPGMKWFDLVFEDRPRRRYQRHLLFWVSWLLYFSISYFAVQHPLLSHTASKWIIVVFVESSLLVLCHIFLAYISIYFLLPIFLQKRRIVILTTVLVTSIVVAIAWSYFCYSVLFSIIDQSGFVEILHV
jgi:hypothetical protein